MQELIGLEECFWYQLYWKHFVSGGDVNEDFDLTLRIDLQSEKETF